MTLLRELSDGFQYREMQDGDDPLHALHGRDGGRVVRPGRPGADLLGHRHAGPGGRRPAGQADGALPGVRRQRRKSPRSSAITREVPCPKDAALKMLLDENEETGRMVIFAGFTGSVDRIVKLCLKEKWDVVRCDQGDFQVFTHDGEGVGDDEEPLDYWANMDHPRVAFVANPESGGMSLTLVEARMAVYWSNSWKPEYRVQSEDRIHRKGMDENLGCTIVDLIHLPSDDRVLDVIRDNRKLELMTMGEVMEGVDWNDASEEGEMRVEEVPS